MSFADELAVWSLIVSVVGTVGTLIGFVVAIRQLSKTKTATEAASTAMGLAADRMRTNHLLVLLPQLHAIELDLDTSCEREDRELARRSLVLYSQLAGQISELLSGGAADESDFIEALRSSAKLAGQAKGRLATDKRVTVKSAVAQVVVEVSSITGRAAGVATQYTTKVA